MVLPQGAAHTCRARISPPARRSQRSLLPSLTVEWTPADTAIAVR